MKNFIIIAVLLILISCGVSTSIKEHNLAPTDLTAFSTINNQIQLGWEDNSDDELGFIIERKTGELEFTIIDTTSQNIDSFLDTEVEVDSAYTYRVCALFQNEISDYSEEVSIVLTSCSPTNLTAFSTCDYEIQLDWEDRSDEEIGFVLERKTNNLSFIIIDTLATDAISFLDENTETGNTYSYRVAALFEDGLSSWSNEVSLDLEIWYAGLEFGTESTFELVTWNLKEFPKANLTTVNYLSQLMLVIDADVYTLQEIASADYFNQLLEKLNLLDAHHTWTGYRANSAGYDYNLAYIYKSDEIPAPTIHEIYQSYSRPFPRRPLVFEGTFQGKDIVVIDNHLKAGGDGIMNLEYPMDDETRRYEACNLLDEYIAENFPDSRVLVSGDYNDELTDEEANNVFWTLLSKPAEYEFTDMEIAQGSSLYWSYPSWPSHLDHILITNELFDDFANAGSECETILINDYLPGGWNQYYQYISDHRPVGIKINFNE